MDKDINRNTLQSKFGLEATRNRNHFFASSDKRASPTAVGDARLLLSLGGVEDEKKNRKKSTERVQNRKLTGARRSAGDHHLWPVTVWHLRICSVPQETSRHFCVILSSALTFISIPFTWSLWAICSTWIVFFIQGFNGAIDATRRWTRHLVLTTLWWCTRPPATVACLGKSDTALTEHEHNYQRRIAQNRQMLQTCSGNKSTTVSEGLVCIHYLSFVLFYRLLECW